MANISPPGDWSHLVNLTAVIKQLSEQQCMNDLQSLLNHVNGLQAKTNEQATTIESRTEDIASMAEEIARLTKEHKERQEEVIESNARLLRKRDDEKVALNQAFTEQQSELHDSKTTVQKLQAHIETLESQLQGQDTEVKRIESQLQQARTDIDHLNKSAQDRQEQIKSKEQQWQNERKAHGQSKSQVEALNERCNDLEAEVQAVRHKLDQIDKLAPPLAEDSIAKVSKGFRKIWKLCVDLNQNCFREDNPIQQLNELNIRRSLQSSNLITYAMPLAPTNSPAARRMRLCAALAILTNSLAHHLFTSTYLFKYDEEVDKIMFRMACTNPPKEALFRSLMTSTFAGVEDQSLEERSQKIMDDVLGHVQLLLSVEQKDKMSSSLLEMLKQAASLWQSLRGRQSYFVVEPDIPLDSGATWMSLIWDDGKKTFVEEPVTAPKDVVLVLFPRIIAINHEKEQEVFPGVVLLKPETSAAFTELNELPLISPTTSTRTGSHRLSTGRRAVVDRKTESGTFLAQNGSSKPSA